MEYKSIRKPGIPAGEKLIRSLFDHVQNWSAIAMALSTPPRSCCFFLLLLLGSASIGGARGTMLHLVNYGGGAVCARYWVPNNMVGGGCKLLQPGEVWEVAASPAWRAATVWAVRAAEACEAGGSECETGPAAGATQFELTVAGAWGNDYYDVSMLAGFNLGLKLTPSNPACASVSCLLPDAASCRGFFPGGPDRTHACRYASSDYTLAFYD